MINWDKVSDFEINLAVAKERLDYDDIDPHPYNNTSAVHWSDGANWHKFDACNNLQDVAPLIEELKMNIRFMDPRWMVYVMGKRGVSIDYRDLNLKRAAAIVYLMLKNESEL